LQLENEVSIRRALIQSLGGLNTELIPVLDRNRITKQLKALYGNDPDSGIHSSASWTLRQWGETLPELPVGEPTLSEEQKALIAKLTAEFEDIRQRMVAVEQELPVRQAVWERQLREQPAALPKSLSDGLMAHFPLDETEGNGTANRVEGQPSGVYGGPGEPTWVLGIVGNAVRLDGKGGHFACGESFAPERTDAFSYGCWFHADAESKRGVLFSKFASADEQGFAVNVDPVAGDVICEWSHHYPENTQIVRAKVPEIAGQWHHLFVVYDGSSQAAGVTVYVDGLALPLGIELDRLSESIQVSSPSQIGKRDTQFAFQGTIDDVRIYNRRLDEGEVQQLYEAGLRALAGVPSETRTPEQQALLSAAYRPQDEPLQRLESQLVATETTLRDARWRDLRRWYFNGQGQTMVLFPKPVASDESSLNHSFAIASHEVTVTEFRRFREQHVVRSSVAPTEDCPVHYVNWYDAVAYCNWLSEQEGISEGHWVYEPNDQGQYAEGMTIKDNAVELSGYRLPTEAEWELACRAGSSGTYGYGEPVPLLERYARYIVNSSPRTHSVQSLLSNTLGLFDMHGNVWEWVQNPFSGPMSPVTGDVSRMFCGGSFLDRSSNVRSASRAFYPPGSRGDHFGFRPARTYHQFP
jgi:hypothetical protein